ncbi:MAG: Maf family protein [Rhodoferax sp.]
MLYLASQSPRRSQLLDQMGLAHTLLLPGADEDAEALEIVRPHEAPKAYVQRVTRLKLEAAQARLRTRGLSDGPVLCADTTVALGSQILGKPVDAADAARILRMLSGQRHRVLTAVAVGWGTRYAQACSESWVQFAPLSVTDIADYVASGEPMGKAGAYGIQGRAAQYIAKISGSYSGIMGLPLYETAQVLKALGWHG